MSRRAGEQATEFALPDIGVRLPGWAPRAGFAFVSLALCWCILPNIGWIIAGCAVTAVCVVAVWTPIASGALLLLLGGSVFWQQVSPTNWRFYVVLAGLHFLFLVGTQLISVRVRSRIQLAALVPALRRFLIIQIPVQIASFLLLTFFAGRPANLPGAIPVPVVALIAGVALAVLAVILIVPMLRSRR